jgi:hypothetical protein
MRKPLGNPMRDQEHERLWLTFGCLSVLVIWIVYVSCCLPAHSAPAAKVESVPAFTVEGGFVEPEVEIETQINGKETVTLQHQWLPGKEITVPVTELRFVSRAAKQTHIGVCAGKRAARQGDLRTRNRVFLKQWKVACAAFTAFCCRPCGRSGLSFSAHQQYNQLRKRGGKLVISKGSTRSIAYHNVLRRGDYLFFWKSGSRIGHVEIAMGGGWTVGTSSSAGYVARRRIANRGFRTYSVVRL